MTADASSGLNTDLRPATALQSQIEVAFDDPTLLRAALTHPSYANEHAEEQTEHNERLEFLGDSVLGMVVTGTLFERFPAVPEGRLTEWRSHLVCGPTLSRVAAGLGLGEWLRLGRGEERTGGREREGNLERAYEALVGAIFLDQGLPAARAFIDRTLGAEFELLEHETDMLNPKGSLQELAQQLLRETSELGGRPDYVLVSEYGPDHARSFEVEVRLGGESLGRGQGQSKRQAEKAAATEALAILRRRGRAGGDLTAEPGGA